MIRVRGLAGRLGVAGVAVAAGVALATAACADWDRSVLAPALNGGFATGARLGGKSAETPTVVRVAGDVGATRWYHRGAGVARRYLGLGGDVSVGWEEGRGADLGADVIFAVPRADRAAGLQLRAGPRLRWDQRSLGTSFTAEWAHWLAGSIFAEASWDFGDHEGQVLFGARVNLLLPYVLVTVDTFPIDE